MSCDSCSRITAGDNTAACTPSKAIKHRLLLSIPLVIFISFLIVFSCILIRTGPIINLSCGWDPTFILDGGWRVLSGQIPHIDFHPPVGSLIFIFLALAMMISGVSMTSFVTMKAVLFIVFSLWAWALARKRMSSLGCLLVSMAVGAVTIGNYVIGFDIGSNCYAMLYNRFGFAMLILILIEGLFISERDDKRSETLGGISTGVLLAALFFMKANFFFIAAILIVFKSVFICRSKKWLYSLMAGAALFTLPMMIYLRFNPAAYISDILMILRAHSVSIFSKETILNLVMPLLVEFRYKFSYILIAWMIIPDFRFERNNISFSKASLLMAGLALVISDVLLKLSCWSGQTDLPLMIVVSVLLLEYYLRSARSRGVRYGGIFVVLILMLVFVNCDFYYKNLRSVWSAYFYKKENLDKIPTINSEVLKNLYVPPVGIWGRYPAIINDGLDLLRRNIGKDDRIMPLDFSDPFSVGLKQISPKGGVLMLGYDHSFNEKVHFDHEYLFKDVTVIIVPRWTNKFTVTPLLNIYGRDLNEHYIKKDKSEYWDLYKRR